MALVSGGRSVLNPNAPLFIPAAVRQVEDFSPEWWDLVNTSAWFRDYWLNQHQGEDSFYDNDNYEYRGHDVVDLLPDSIDLGIDEDFANMEAQFEEFIHSSETEEAKKPNLLYMDPLWESGVAVNSEALKSMSLSKSPKEKNPRSEEPAKYWGMPGKSVSPKCSPRRIQQLC